MNSDLGHGGLPPFAGGGWQRESGDPDTEVGANAPMRLGERNEFGELAHGSAHRKTLSSSRVAAVLRHPLKEIRYHRACHDVNRLRDAASALAFIARYLEPHRWPPENDHRAELLTLLIRRIPEISDRSGAREKVYPYGVAEPTDEAIAAADDVIEVCRSALDIARVIPAEQRERYEPLAALADTMRRVPSLIAVPLREEILMAAVGARDAQTIDKFVCMEILADLARSIVSDGSLFDDRGRADVYPKRYVSEIHDERDAAQMEEILREMLGGVYGLPPELQGARLAAIARAARSLSGFSSRLAFVFTSVILHTSRAARQGELLVALAETSSYHPSSVELRRQALKFARVAHGDGVIPDLQYAEILAVIAQSAALIGAYDTEQLLDELVDSIEHLPPMMPRGWVYASLFRPELANDRRFPDQMRRFERAWQEISKLRAADAETGIKMLFDIGRLDNEYKQKVVTHMLDGLEGGRRPHLLAPVLRQMGPIVSSLPRPWVEGLTERVLSMTNADAGVRAADFIDANCWGQTDYVKIFAHMYEIEMARPDDDEHAADRAIELTHLAELAQRLLDPKASSALFNDVVIGLKKVQEPHCFGPLRAAYDLARLLPDKSPERSAALKQLQELELPDPTNYETAEDWQRALRGEPT